MSDEKEKKKYEHGTRSVAHLVVESAKFNTPVKKLDGTTFDAARIMATGKFGGKEIKMATKALEQPFNAALKKQFKDVCDQFKIAFANDEELKITYTSEFNAKSGYWNPVSIEIGHIGRDGIVRANGDGGNSNNSGGGGYSNEDAQAGQVLNISVAMLQAQGKKGGFTMQDVKALAVSIVDAYKDAKEATKIALKGLSQKTAESKDVADIAGDDIGDSITPSELDDDIPY